MLKHHQRGHLVDATSLLSTFCKRAFLRLSDENNCLRPLFTLAVFSSFSGIGFCIFTCFALRSFSFCCSTSSGNLISDFRTFHDFCFGGHLAWLYWAKRSPPEMTTSTPMHISHVNNSFIPTRFSCYTISQKATVHTDGIYETMVSCGLLKNCHINATCAWSSS